MLMLVREEYDAALAAACDTLLLLLRGGGGAGADGAEGGGPGRSAVSCMLIDHGDLDLLRYNNNTHKGLLSQ